MGRPKSYIGIEYAHSGKDVTDLCFSITDPLELHSRALTAAPTERLEMADSQSQPLLKGKQSYLLKSGRGAL